MEITKALSKFYAKQELSQTKELSYMSKSCAKMKCTLSISDRQIKYIFYKMKRETTTKKQQHLIITATVADKK